MIALADHREITTTKQPEGQRTITELTKTVSTSRLSTWQRCRLQFYFRYIAGIQKSPTPALHIGTTVHTVLRQWNLARWRGRDIEVQELKEIYLAHHLPGNTGGVSPRGYQLWIYYPTWTRLDPLVFGVALAAIEKYRASWWNILTGFARWLWLPALAAIVLGLYMGEGDLLTIRTCVWQLPLIAFGMAALLVCAVSAHLPFSRIELPGAAFVASIAYSVYLSHKLVIRSVIQLCGRHAVSLTSAWAILLVEAAIFLTGAVLFFLIERPFLLLRNRVAP